MSLVFFDTNLFVYWFEDHPEFAPRVAEIRGWMTSRADRLSTSTLTRGELLAGAFARNDLELVQRYQSILGPPLLDLLSFTPEASDIFGRLRAEPGLSTADAIQLASAAAAKCDLFITNDRRLSRKVVSGIGFIVNLDARLF